MKMNENRSVYLWFHDTQGNRSVNTQDRFSAKVSPTGNTWKGRVEDTESGAFRDSELVYQTEAAAMEACERVIEDMRAQRKSRQSKFAL